MNKAEYKTYRAMPVIIDDGCLPVRYPPKSASEPPLTLEELTLHKMADIIEGEKTLRDEFAIAALAGLLSNVKWLEHIEDVSSKSYQVADAMLKERVK